jgi:hypothetical protein
MKMTMIASLVMGACISGLAQAPMPLPGNPGNIFVQGQQVVLPLNAQSGGEWQATDLEGHVVASGKADGGHADLGVLPVGYYSVRTGNSSPVSLAVIAPLKAATPSDSPLGIALPSPAWNTNPETWRRTASISALAGVEWARTAVVWSKIEPARGEFDVNHSYDKYFDITRSAGLRTLIYVQQAPEWAGAENRRFPPDLREAFAFYREMASRWKNDFDAIEPFNEPNARNTGAEIATYQKVAYLAIKATTPSVIVCSSPLMGRTPPEVLENFEANDASAYFDVFDFHHYIDDSKLPEYYKKFRPLSGGKPFWITEFNDPVAISPESSVDDPSPADMKLQMERLPKLYAVTLFHGAQQAFYFVLLNFTQAGKNYGIPNAQVQFGVLHKDLTPRPTYLALAAVGRLLAGAHPLGKLELRGADSVYAFSARPDGKSSDVLVAWTTSGSSSLRLPSPMTAAYNAMGQTINPTSAQEIKVSTSPEFIVLPAGTVSQWTNNSASRVSLTPRPQPAPAAANPTASPVVLQAAFSGEQLELLEPGERNLSADFIQSGRPLQIFVYNFSDRQLQVSLQIKAPRGWVALLSTETLTLPPGQRVPVSLNVNSDSGRRGMPSTIFIKASGPGVGDSVLAVNVTPER